MPLPRYFFKKFRTLKFAMKKFLCLLVILTCISSSTANADQRTLQGASCTQAGKIKKIGTSTYSCQKNGKKFRWQLISQPIATKTLHTVLDKGLVQLQERIDSNFDKVAINIITEPGLENYLWTKDSIGSIGSAKQLLSAFQALPQDPLDAYVVWDINFIKPYINSGCFSWAPTSGGGACGPKVMWANLKWFGENIQVNNPNEMTNYLSESKKQWILANLQHEMAHVGQHVIAERNKTDKESTPAWIREGEAEVFKVLAYANQFNITYSKSRSIYFGESYFRCSSESLENLAEPRSYSSACEYDNGLLGIEFLIQKVGDIQALFWWDQRAKGADLREKFKNAYGLDYDLFIAEANSYIRSQK